MAKRKPISNAEHKQRVDDFIKKQMDLFLEIIENNRTEKWVKPWKDIFGGLGSLPHNPATKHRYSGGNVLFLMLDMMIKGYQDPRFLTLGQARRYAEEQGLDPKDVRIKKGEKASWILQPIVIGGKKKDDQENQEKPKSLTDKILDGLTDKSKTGSDNSSNDEKSEDEKVWIHFKTVARFNAEQFDNFPQIKDLAGDDEGYSVDSVITHLVESCQIDLRHGHEAKYSFKLSDPEQDYIEMPFISTFDDPAHYHVTLLHEWFHASGGKAREDRIVPGDKEAYAREELRAQFFMIAASAVLDIPIELEKEADYVEGFRKGENLDYKDLYKEFKSASRIFTEAFVPFLEMEQPSLSWFPDKSTWPERSKEVEEETVKATARILSPNGPVQTPPSHVPDVKKETDEPPVSTDDIAATCSTKDQKGSQESPHTAKPIKEADKLDIAIFDLVSEKPKKQPSQMDIFDFGGNQDDSNDDDSRMRM